MTRRPPVTNVGSKSSGSRPATPAQVVRQKTTGPAGQPAASTPAHSFSDVGVTESVALPQPKLRVSRPEDPLEREADRIADEVMRADPLVQRQVRSLEDEEEEEIQAKTVEGSPSAVIQRVNVDEEEEEQVQMEPAPGAQASRLTTASVRLVHPLSTTGKPLDPGPRTFMESRFGHSFRNVRVHSGPEAVEAARALNARAYTLGRDIVFGAGEYEPRNSEGRHLLAHELTHVLQQGGGSVAHGAQVMRQETDYAPLTRTATQDRPDGDLLAQYAGFTENGLKRDISGNLANSIYQIQAARIDSWGRNARIEETRPGQVLLAIALTVVSAGIGKVLSGLINRAVQQAVASQITQDFIDGLAGKTIDMALGAASDGLQNLLSADHSDAQQGAEQGLAITAQSGLIDYYTEGMKLTLHHAKTTRTTEFNRRASVLSRHELILMHKGLEETINILRSDPSAFMQSLTIGYMKLLDELHITSEAESYEGATPEERRANLYEQNEAIDETDQRRGNLLLIGENVGLWQNPNFRLDRAIVSRLNRATYEHLEGAKVDDLPFSLAFRFWGRFPGGWITRDRICRVWFVRRPDGTIAVSLNELRWGQPGRQLREGQRWLAHYNLETERELSDTEVRNNVARGARKVYNQIKNQRVPRVLNTDLF